ncbi:hypothetical protein ACTJK9_02335 [Pseudomonas sp. 22082]|uniref:hypothetical protein n=1 Tax=Pseudomonas TaxID=286 RepID=UPI003F85761E
MAQEFGGHRNLFGDLAGMSILFNGSVGENRCVPIFLLGFSMFNRSDFDQLSGKEVTYWSARDDCRGLYYVTYPAFAFQCPYSQETIRIARAPKQQGENGLKFWLHAECVDWHPERESYFLGYVSDAKFEEISETVFNQMVADQARDLIAPLKQPLHEPNGFIGALLMYSMKTEFTVSLFAEYKDEYIHFYWDTIS